MQIQTYENLEFTFRQFSGNNPEMDGRQFAKLAKDCDFLGKDLTLTDVDLIFTRVKSRSARKIYYAQFLEGLARIARKKNVYPSSIMATVENVGGPKFVGTKAQNVSLNRTMSTDVSL